MRTPTASQIVFLVGEGKTLPIALTGELVCVGRSAENTIRVEEPTVSEHHAELTRQEGAWRCRDLGSMNGTRVNGEPLVGAEPRELRDGDHLAFGAVGAIYRDSPAPASPEIGAVLENAYYLEEFLGEGPGYENFRAEDLTDDARPVSLRIFPPPIVRLMGGFAALEREFARVQAVPHPNLIRLLALRPRGDGGALLASEWIQGMSLLNVLRRRRALTPREALRLLLPPAAAAVDHARKSGLPGVDLDPRPILLAFAGPAPANEAPLDARLETWPPFVLKASPQLTSPGDPNATDPALTPGESGSPVPALAALACELLGHPLSGGAERPGPRRGRTLIACLGDAGNEVLAQGLSASDARFPSAVEFVQTLARAVDL